MTKQYFLVMFIIGECALYLGYYALADEGYHATKALKKNIKQLQQEIADYHQEIEYYDKLIRDWKNYPYYHESFMREELQYIYPDEEILRYTI